MSTVNYSINRYREAEDGTVLEEADYDLVISYRCTVKGSAPRVSGPPEDCDPGWDPEFSIDVVAWNGKPFELKESEEDAIYDWIVENHEEGENEYD